MILGALYMVLTLATVLLWAKTNTPDQLLNIWRFFLIEVAAVGGLFVRHQSWGVYLLAFCCLLVMASSHTVLFLVSHREFGWIYVVATYVAISLGYWFFAWMMHPGVKTIAPLIILVPGLFFTYVPIGKRWWAVFAEANSR